MHFVLLCLEIYLKLIGNMTLDLNFSLIKTPPLTSHHGQNTPDDDDWLEVPVCILHYCKCVYISHIISYIVQP